MKRYLFPFVIVLSLYAETGKDSQYDYQSKKDSGHNKWERINMLEEHLNKVGKGLELQEKSLKKIEKGQTELESWQRDKAQTSMTKFEQFYETELPKIHKEIAELKILVKFLEKDVEKLRLGE